jgi:hypothetical protein
VFSTLLNKPREADLDFWPLLPSCYTRRLGIPIVFLPMYIHTYMHRHMCKSEWKEYEQITEKQIFILVDKFIFLKLMLTTVSKLYCFFKNTLYVAITLEFKFW